MNNLYKIILVSVNRPDASEFPEWSEYSSLYPNVSREDYDEMKEEIMKDSFDAYAEDVLYSVDKDTAIQILKSNVGDISNEGVFAYGLILQTPLDTVYPDKYAEIVGCYLYDSRYDSYKEISEDYNDEIRIIVERIIPE